MKKTIYLPLSVLFLVFMFAAALPQKATKAQVQSSVDDSVVQEAAQQRLCDGLKLIHSKLRQIQGTVSTVAGIHGDFTIASGRIKSEGLTPLYEKRVVAGGPAGTIAGLAPAEKARMRIHLTEQVQGIRTKATGIYGILNNQIADLQKSWRALEGDMKRVTGLKAASAVTPGRRCVSEAAKKVESELAALGSQTNNLQSEIEDVRAALDQEYGGGPCGESCENLDCSNCCAWQHKITAPEGTAGRSIQEAERAQCQLACIRLAAACAFMDFDNKAHNLFGILSTVIKTTEEMSTGIVRNLN